MRRAVTGFLALLLTLASTPLAFAGGTVAVPKMRGPKKAGVDKAARAIEAELKNSGYRVLGAAQLREAADESGEGAASVATAKAAGADVLLLGRASRKKKRYILTVDLVDVSTGDVVQSAEYKYRSGKKAGKGGRVIVRKLDASIAEIVQRNTERNAERSRPVTPVVVPEAPPPPPPVTSAPKEETPAEVVAEPEAPTDGAKPIVVFRLGAGSQVLTAYTVSVGPEPTALAYRLSPLLAIGVGARLQIPSTGLAIEADFSFSPVKYALDTDPAVEPAEPAGSFIDVGATIGYSFQIANLGEGSTLGLEPLVGFQFESLSVAEQVQAADQTPLSIVVGSTAIAPHLGTRLLFDFGAVELQADLRLRIVASYSEKPAKTGDSGSGLGVYGGLDGRYWISDLIGLSMALGYEFTKVGFSGTGDRPVFQNDPDLIDATVFSSNLSVGLGVLLAI